MTTRQVRDTAKRHLRSSYFQLFILVELSRIFSAQLVSILLSCIWFAHPLTAEQLIGAVSISFHPRIYIFIEILVSNELLNVIWQVIVFGSIYSKTYFRSKPKPVPAEQTENRAVSPPRSNA